jgi:hypothetical protein
MPDHQAVPLPGYKCLVNLTSTPSVGSTDLVLTDAGDHQHFTVPLASIYRYIDRNTAVVVQTTLDGSTWTTATVGTYTLRYLTAQVVLNVALSGGTSYGCRLHTFNYYAYASIAYASDIVFAASNKMLDVTSFQGSSGTGFMQFIPGLNGGTFACKSWYPDSAATVYAAHVTARDLLILSFVDPTGIHAFESYCYAKDSNWHGPVAGANDQTLNFQCDSIVALI